MWSELTSGIDSSGGERLLFLISSTGMSALSSELFDFKPNEENNALDKFGNLPMGRKLLGTYLLWLFSFLHSDMDNCGVVFRVTAFDVQRNKFKTCKMALGLFQKKVALRCL